MSEWNSSVPGDGAALAARDRTFPPEYDAAAAADPYAHLGDRFEGLDVRVVWRPASPGRRLRSWPWLVSCGALALAILWPPNRASERQIAASDSAPAAGHSDTDAVRVLGWRGAAPIVVRTETIPNFGYHGVIAPEEPKSTFIEPRAPLNQIPAPAAAPKPVALPAPAPTIALLPEDHPRPATVIVPAAPVAPPREAMEPTAPHRGFAVPIETAAAKSAEPPPQVAIIMPALPPGPPPPFAMPASAIVPRPVTAQPVPTAVVSPPVDRLIAPEPPWGLKHIASTPPVVTPAPISMPVEPKPDSSSPPAVPKVAPVAKPPEKPVAATPKAKPKPQPKPERSSAPRPKTQPSSQETTPSWGETAYKVRG